MKNWTICPGCKTVLGIPRDCEPGTHLYCVMCDRNLIWDGEKFVAMRTMVFDFLKEASAITY